MGRKQSDLRDDGVPSVVFWLAQQHLNSDTERATAARYVGERWPYTNGYNHAKVLKTLAAEEDPHLNGMRLLTEDYADLFGLAPDEQFEHVGVISPLVPVGRERCGHTLKSDKQCPRDAIPGAGLCGYHGGSWINESERAEMVGKVSEKLVDLSGRAIEVLAHLMDNARSEKVRQDSAMAILDRIGVGPVNKLELSVTPAAEEAAEQIRARVIELAASDGVRVDRNRPGSEIVPGEVVPPPEATGAAQ